MRVSQPENPSADTVPVHYKVLLVEPVTGAGQLVGLAVVRVELAGVELTLQGVQVRSGPVGLVVEVPRFRHPKDGRWLPAVLLPFELQEAIGKEVLALAAGD